MNGVDSNTEDGRRIAESVLNGVGLNADDDRRRNESARNGVLPIRGDA
jgi:hypothetical protein